MKMLYQDKSPPTTTCYYPYPGSETSVCSDIIALPIRSEPTVQTVMISTAHLLNLCEVEVFGTLGMIFFKQITIL